MLPFTTVIRIIAPIGVSLLVAMEPALAGCVAATVPAPIAGAGIPALFAIAGGYWALRKRPRR
jgi:hypothetical protein